MISITEQLGAYNLIYGLTTYFFLFVTLFVFSNLKWFFNYNLLYKVLKQFQHVTVNQSYISKFVKIKRCTKHSVTTVFIN